MNPFSKRSFMMVLIIIIQTLYGETSVTSSAEKLSQPEKDDDKNINRFGRFLIARCGSQKTLPWPLFHQTMKTTRTAGTDEFRLGDHIRRSIKGSHSEGLMDAVAEEGGYAIINVIPTNPNKIWRFAFCDSIKRKRQPITDTAINNSTKTSSSRTKH